MAALPFTTAAGIREDALRFVCVSQGEIARLVTLDTSGTTGAPKRLYFTAADQELTIDFFQVGMATMRCVARLGYHLREADLYVEIVGPHTGHILPDGDEGEIVFTTLTRRGMPLIRYRTGDVGRLIPGPCPCGTSLKTLAHVTRRRDNVVQLPTGDTLALAELDERLFALEGVVDFAAAHEPGVLTLTLASHRNEAIVPEARATLSALPVIARAVESGGLRLDVSVAPAGVPSPAKRTFITANRANLR